MNLPYEIRIGLRYALTGRNDRFVSFVSLMSAAGIALGVAALIVVLAVMNGFHQELRARILSVASHLEALSLDRSGFSDWSSIADDYLQHPDVLAAAPNVQQQALLVAGDKTQGTLVRGILPQQEQTVSRLGEYITEGDLSALTAGSYGIFMGEKLAQQLRVGVGDDVILLAPQGKLTAAGFYPRLRRFHVAGIFVSGLYQYDSGLSYINLTDAQKIYRLQGPTSIRLQVEELLQAPALRDKLSNINPKVFLHDWTTSHGGLFRALVFEKKVMFIILTLIIAVAAFNIVSALVTMVRNKRSDIAILRAMGASSGGIMRIFLFQGTIIGIFGTFIGVVAGIPIAINAGLILETIENLFGRDLFPGSVYHLDRLPSLISFSDSFLVAGIAVLLSLAATAFPAWYSGRLRPVEALRYE
ncbi:MAG: lipoprotein-releasing ABC transporter permease subunit [Proteobacteria bacterium]|nr:lipoprotein-releasing ABC transporter permease subunit [Pseudomonadota bacterium]MCH9757516.1 lipoprotein-releasing ABC transporter permease subunit [Pseudomonadota bacterium]